MPFDFNGQGSAGSRDSDVSGSSSAHGFQNAGGVSAGGFQNVPVRKSAASSPNAPRTLSAPVRTGDAHQQRTRQTRQRRPTPRREIVIPWRIILIIAGVCMFVAVLWVNRDVITAFLSQVLSWVITILVIIFLVKVFILRR